MKRHRAYVVALALLSTSEVAATVEHEPFDLGDKVTVREAGPGDTEPYDGTWTRRGDSALYDAQWIYQPNGQRITDTLEVLGVREGQLFIRRGSLGTYSIPTDGVRAPGRGSATWYAPGSGFNWRITGVVYGKSLRQRIIALQPKIETPRALSGEEKDWLRNYQKFADSGYAQHHDRPEYLYRLRKLARTGDQESITAFINELLRYNLRVSLSTKIIDDVPKIEAGMWGRYYWEHFGPDRTAARGIGACLDNTIPIVLIQKMGPRINMAGGERGNLNCGFDVSWRNETFTSFALWGNPKSTTKPPADVVFTDRPIAVDAATELAGLVDYMTLVRRGAYYGIWLQLTARDIAARNGQAEQLKQVETAAAEYYSKRVKQRAAPDPAVTLAKFQQRLAGYKPASQAEKWRIEQEAIDRGGDYLRDYARAGLSLNGVGIGKLCAIDAELCGQQEALQARLMEENRKLAAARALKASDIIQAGGNGFVEVRNYDAHGNYLGSTTTTQGMAEIITNK